MKSLKYHPSRRNALALGAAAMFWPVVGRASLVESVSGTAFGTTWRMAGPSGSALDRLRPAVESAFAEIDRQMSPWRADSEIARFNAADAGAHVVSGDTAQVVTASLALAGESGGAFDPTVGPLVARWGFGPISGSEPDWRGIAVDEGILVKREAGLTLDLCGIAKGWALDRAIGIAREAGEESLLMDLGGELAAIGTHPSGRDWRVAVENPFHGPAPAALRLKSGQAVATSGMAAQSYGIGGRKYGHIIDPRRRMPANGELKSVSVVATCAMEADGWATALFAAGPDAGPELASSLGIAALFLIGDDLRQVHAGGIGTVKL